MNSIFTPKGDVIDDSFTCNDDLMTVRETAVLLRVPDSWVYDRTRRCGVERIPHFKLGKYLRFSKIEVLNWVQRQRGI